MVFLYPLIEELEANLIVASSVGYENAEVERHLFDRITQINSWHELDNNLRMTVRSAYQAIGMILSAKRTHETAAFGNPRAEATGLIVRAKKEAISKIQAALDALKKLLDLS